LADKGVVEAVAATNVGSFGPPASNQKPASDGWNEVAKKGPVAASAPREDANAAFKVVASKKKGKR
jgi:PERQ amino acid-rich with GYF domain-containing protein